MSESMQHKSTLRVAAVGPVTWTAYGGVTERRVVVEMRGMLVLSLDDAHRFIGDLRSAVNDAERA